MGLGKHQRMVDDLATRLSQKGYDHVEKNVEWERNGLNGEWDVIAWRRKGDVFHVHYYEVKSNRTMSLYKKAMSQFARTETAYPNIGFKYVLVRPRSVTRHRRVRENPVRVE